MASEEATQLIGLIAAEALRGGQRFLPGAVGSGAGFIGWVSSAAAGSRFQTPHLAAALSAPKP